MGVLPREVAAEFSARIAEAERRGDKQAVEKLRGQERATIAAQQKQHQSKTEVELHKANVLVEHEERLMRLAELCVTKQDKRELVERLNNARIILWRQAVEDLGSNEKMASAESANRLYDHMSRVFGADFTGEVAKQAALEGATNGSATPVARAE